MGILTRSTWFRLAPGITRSTNSTGLPGPASEPLRDNHAVPRSHGSNRALQRAAGCQMDGDSVPRSGHLHQVSQRSIRAAQMIYGANQAVSTVPVT